MIEPASPESVRWVDPAKANLDPQTRAVLADVAAQPRMDVMRMDPQARRRAHEAFFMPRGLPQQDLTDVEDRSILGPGGPMRVRLYTPREGTAPRPVLVYFHGGGFSVGSIEQYDSLCQRLSQRSGVIVASVDYRLAPEHRFPAQIDDALFATQWAYDNAASFGGDPSRFAVGGDSGGGLQAAVVTQWARDRGGPPIVFQLLIYPAVGYAPRSASMIMFGKGYLFEAEEFGIILRDSIDEHLLNSPIAQPILARDFSRLPPAFVISAGFEIMRDVIEEYAHKLQAAGVPTQLRRYATTIHPFLSLAGAIDVGRQAIDECADQVREGIARATSV